jgi:sucrose-6-phosphate hydrolase SacC (GH32 family)
MPSPTTCSYAPAGEFIKDHTLLFHDGWWHLYSISGTDGYYHGYNGNEETISWSISRDLVNWEMRGHVLHASQRAGAFDQHEVWAPYCIRANDKFYLFYAGIVHPHRPLSYERPGPNHGWIYEGHRETIGVAVSSDLTDWVKMSDVKLGTGIPGRDPHVVWDDRESMWLLYSTGPCRSDGLSQAYVARSPDLLQWEFMGCCALMPDIEQSKGGNSESMTVMRHPVDREWILMANWQYVRSHDPHTFLRGDVRTYEDVTGAHAVQIGVAGELIVWEGTWYRSGFFGGNHSYRLGFSEIEWQKGGAFQVVTPSCLAM